MSSGKPYDPFEPWRGMRDAAMESWSKSLIEAVNSEAYAQATGAMLDAYLTASAPFREALEKAMAQSLQQLNMPTREDFISLAERMTNIEMRLDDLDAAMHRIELLLTRPAAPPARASAATAPETRPEHEEPAQGQPFPDRPAVNKKKHPPKERP